MSNVKISAQYIKDLSFEVPNAPKVFFETKNKPNVELSIDIDARKIQDESFEVILKIKAEADKQKTFILDIQYSGIFVINDIKKDMLEEILLVYCPNILFPFVRRIISNTISDGGFSPLLINPIDFYSLYKKRNESKQN